MLVETDRGEMVCSLLQPRLKQGDSYVYCPKMSIWMGEGGYSRHSVPLGHKVYLWTNWIIFCVTTRDKVLCTTMNGRNYCVQKYFGTTLLDLQARATKTGNKDSPPQAFRVNCALRNSRYLISLWAMDGRWGWGRLPDGADAVSLCCFDSMNMTEGFPGSAATCRVALGVCHDSRVQKQAAQMAQHLSYVWLATQLWEPELRS